MLSVVILFIRVRFKMVIVVPITVTHLMALWDLDSELSEGKGALAVNKTIHRSTAVRTWKIELEVAGM